MQSNYNYSHGQNAYPVSPVNIEATNSKLVKPKNRGIAKDIQKLANDFFSEFSLKKEKNRISEGRKCEAIPSQNDDRIATIEKIAITHDVLSLAHTASPMSKSDGKGLMKELFSAEVLVLEIHEKDGKQIKYHAAHTLKGQQILAKNGLILHKKHGIIAINEEAKAKLMNQKFELHDDPTASPEIREMVAVLREQPLNVSYLNSTMMENFKELLMQQIMTMQVMHAEPQAHVKSEDIQNMDKTPASQTAQKGKTKEKDDPFIKTKEILIQIFLSSYQVKLALERDRILKAREEEKENKRALEKKERIHEIEKKENKDKEATHEMLAKNRSQHAQLDKNAAEVESVTRSRKSDP